MLKAWAQLVRLPNVFTAPADVIAGAGLTMGGTFGLATGRGTAIAILCAASICLYAAGMILNDVFDFKEDSRERPFRPLPSGRIHRTTASIVGGLLLLVGTGLALSQVPIDKLWPYSIPVFLLPLLILAYNLWLKNTILGPLAMGGCRGLNLLLGSLIAIPMPFPLAEQWAAYNVMVYITGVTIVARDETKHGQRLSVKFGVGLIFVSVLLVIAMISLVHFFIMLAPTVFLLLIAWIGLVGYYLAPAYHNPSPQLVGTAVKYCIFGLVILEAIHATLGMGIPGIALLLLLIPAMFFGKFIYST